MINKIKRIKFEFLRNREICKYKAKITKPEVLEKCNIIYLVPSSKHKSGGDKVLYRQSEVINRLGLVGVTSQVLHPQNPSYRHCWFEHQVNFKKDLHLNPKTDLVVIPEIWAVPHAQALSKIGVQYVIFVQNGYSTSVPLYQWDIAELKEAYDKAKFILSISDDTTKCIQALFPDCASKIIRIFLSVDNYIFNTNSHFERKNIITFMPRKLRKHSELLIFLLRNHLPSNWTLNQIDGLSELAVANELRKSKIFLSFSELEGLGLPPIEAALCGNYVIGYTGQAGKEYWDPRIFTEIQNGDILKFLASVLAKVRELDSDPNNANLANARSALQAKYSSQAEINSLMNFISNVMR